MPADGEVSRRQKYFEYFFSATIFNDIDSQSQCNQGNEGEADKMPADGKVRGDRNILIIFSVLPYLRPNFKVEAR